MKIAKKLAALALLGLWATGCPQLLDDNFESVPVGPDASLGALEPAAWTAARTLAAVALREMPAPRATAATPAPAALRARPAATASAWT